jgi:integrase/recombinase XerD
MSRVKIVLRQKPNKDGSLPLALRITKDRKSSFISLGYNLLESDWDKTAQRVKKWHPNHKQLNNFLLQKLADVTNNALEMESKKTPVSARAVREKIKPAAAATFFAQVQDMLDGLKASGKYNQYTSDKPRIGHFKEFLKGANIAFSDFTPGLLNRFVVYLKSSHKPKRGKGQDRRTHHRQPFGDASLGLRARATEQSRSARRFSVRRR